jgi:predicted Zn-dependent protease
VLFALSTAAACSGGGDTTIDITHDACAPLALVSPAATEVQLTGISDAQALWRERGAPALGLRAGATVEVRFQRAANNFHGLYDDEHGVIYINQQITIRSVLAIVIAHELGHAFGLPHVTDRVSVMNPGNLSTPPTEADQRALAALWGNCQ